MNRREFLKQGLVVSAGVTLGGVPTLARKVSANETPWRTFEVTARLEITEASGPVRAWVPVPLTITTDYFQGEPDHWTGNFTSAKTIQYDKYGTGIVFAEWTVNESAPVLEVVSRFKTQDRQVDLSRKPKPGRKA